MGIAAVTVQVSGSSISKILTLSALRRIFAAPGFEKLQFVVAAEPLAFARRHTVDRPPLRPEGQEFARLRDARLFELAGARPRPAGLFGDRLEADAVLAANAEFESRE